MSDERKAVFLSYGSQDAEAAERICESLRQAGVEVWFDKNELVAGNAWDQKIRRQIKKRVLPSGRMPVFSPPCWLAELPEQCNEPGLDKMMIARQRLGYPRVTHYGEGNAVNQRPVFVGAGGVKIDSAFEPFGIDRNDCDRRVSTQFAVKLNEPGACRARRKRRSDFAQHHCGRDQLEVLAGKVFERALVVRIAHVERGKEEIRIRKSTHHRRGVP